MRVVALKIPPYWQTKPANSLHVFIKHGLWCLSVRRSRTSGPGGTARVFFLREGLGCRDERVAESCVIREASRDVCGIRIQCDGDSKAEEDNNRLRPPLVPA